MKQEVMKVGAVGLGTLALALALGIFASSLMIAPHNAQAFWWPWWKQAHAEEHEHSTSTVAVTVKKYIDGSPATAESADSLSFPMSASWDDPEGIGAGSGSYSLSADSSYQAKTSDMKVGADYSTNEILDGDNVGADCSEEKPYALVGYTTGATLEAAAAETPTTTVAAFTNLSNDGYVIVWNKTCDSVQNPTSGDISGEVTGGTNAENPGELKVTSIDAQKTTAVANGTFEDGWQYVFNITVPSDEPNLSMKFDNWLHSNGSSTIPVANNMRISSAQASATSTVTLTAANTYSSPPLTMTGDLDSGEDGLQVQVLVEVAVPSDTLNGTYSTNYGVKTE